MHQNYQLNTYEGDIGPVQSSYASYELPYKYPKSWDFPAGHKPLCPPPPSPTVVYDPVVLPVILAIYRANHVVH